MPLRSQLFAGSPQLQACLVSHAAHVTPGARGKHVALIQSALVRLGELDSADAKAEAEVYGPKTTAAVLAYKKRFNIINRSYQTQADNIVGKMTIESLDDAIFVLDGSPGMLRSPAPPGPHPKSPPPPQSPAVSGAESASLGFGPTAPASGPTVLTSGPTTPAPAAPGGAFSPPLSTLPPDLQDTIRRTNAVKVPDVLLLFPFLAKHEGPQSASDLSKRFAADPKATAILRDLHARMIPFGIWRHVNIIVNVYEGVGSRGIFCEPFDHNVFLARMKALCTGPVVKLGPVDTPLTDSKFCQDTFNVHGPRDSFREIVKSGPGLHICITQPGFRAKEPCDLHIDTVQQGQVCSRGFCVPLVNGQTIDHLVTVGPWLVKDALKKIPGFK